MAVIPRLTVTAAAEVLATGLPLVLAIWFLADAVIARVGRVVMSPHRQALQALAQHHQTRGLMSPEEETE